MDKEGILSLPNPCAEKVFFLKSRRHKLKEEFTGKTKRERKESTCTWTSELSKVSSSQDGQESSDDEEEDDDDDDDVCIGDLDSTGNC